MLAYGDIDRPLPRQVSIGGPGEVRPGADAVLHARDFISRGKYYATYEWAAFGGPGIEVVSTFGNTARVTVK